MKNNLDNVVIENACFNQNHCFLMLLSILLDSNTSIAVESSTAAVSEMIKADVAEAAAHPNVKYLFGGRQSNNENENKS